MRAFAITLFGLGLALGACSKAEQTKTQADTKQAGADVKADVQQLGQDVKVDMNKAGDQLKDISKDPEVKAAAAKAKDALKDLGGSIKDAARDTKDAPGPDKK